MARPTILTFVPYYLPGYKSGGPIQSIANLVDRLGDTFDFRLVTSDRDATETAPYPDVTPDTWTTVGKAQVRYTSSAARQLPALAHLIRTTPHDVVYLNSVFFPDYTIKPLVLRRLGLTPNRPVVIASRGECSEGALKLKRWKKQAYLSVARWLGLYKGVLWQATSPYEASDIRATMGQDVDVHVAPTLGPAPAPPADVGDAKPPQALRVLFLSRISPMKQLDYAVNVLQQVTSQITFDIVGPIRDESYWKVCKEQIATLPRNVTATYHGGVPHDEVPEIMRAYDLFFLPTAGENYGHVIREALAAGLPVLISDCTPWRDLEDRQLGWDVPLEEKARFSSIIDSCAAMPPGKHRAWRIAIARKQAGIKQDDQSLRDNQDLFMKALSQG